MNENRRESELRRLIRKIGEALSRGDEFFRKKPVPNLQPRLEGSERIVAGWDWPKIGKTIVGAIVVIAALWWVYVTFLHTGGEQHLPPQLSGVEMTPTSQVTSDPWSKYPKLSQAQARDLRNKPNVVNVALLSGGATYLEDRAVILDKGTWEQQDQPLGFSGLSVSGTAVTVTFGENTYHLNIYQGFVPAGSTRVYLVDRDGHIWTKVVADDDLVSLDEAVKALPVQVAPNSEQTLTY